MIISLAGCNASQGRKCVIKSRTLRTLLCKFVANVAVGESHEIGAPSLIILNPRCTPSTELMFWWRRKRGKAGLCTGWVRPSQNMKWSFAACASSLHFRFVRDSTTAWFQNPAAGRQKRRYSTINHPFSKIEMKTTMVCKARKGCLWHCSPLLFHLAVSGSVRLILLFYLKIISCAPFSSFLSFQKAQVDFYQCVFVIRQGRQWRMRPYKLHPECLSWFCCFPLNVITVIILGTSLCDSHYQDVSH